MTEELFDEFLQDATLKLREVWELHSGRKLELVDAQALNDVLAGFFEGKS